MIVEIIAIKGLRCQRIGSLNREYLDELNTECDRITGVPPDLYVEDPRKIWRDIDGKIIRGWQVFFVEVP